MPDPDPKLQALALLQLMGQFKISIADESQAVITPGFYTESSLFDIYLELDYDQHPSNAARIQVCMNTGEIRQLAGMYPLPPSRVEYRDDRIGGSNPIPPALTTATCESPQLVPRTLVARCPSKC